MTDIEDFVGRALAYCARSGLSPSTLSRKLLGNGNRLGELERGKSLRVDTFQRAKLELERLEGAA